MISAHFPIWFPLARCIGPVLVALLAFTAGCAGGNFRSVGSAGWAVFEVDLDSIRRDGDIVYFRLRSRSTLEYRLDYEGLIGVDCVKRTRAEYVNSTSFAQRPGQMRTRAGAAEMKTVFAGTRQAEELDTVCALAPPAKPAQPTTPPIAPAAHLRSMATAAGFSHFHQG